MSLSGQVSGQQAKEEVSQLVRGLGAALEEKRASLLQAIEDCQQERLARLRAQLQEQRSLLDGSGLVGYAQEVLKETDQPCFVQAAKQLHNRYSRARLRGILGETLHRPSESWALRAAVTRSNRHPACLEGRGRDPKQMPRLWGPAGRVEGPGGCPDGRA